LVKNGAIQGQFPLTMKKSPWKIAGYMWCLWHMWCLWENNRLDYENVGSKIEQKIVRISNQSLCIKRIVIDHSFREICDLLATCNLFKTNSWIVGAVYVGQIKLFALGLVVEGLGGELGKGRGL